MRHRNDLARQFESVTMAGVDAYLLFAYVKVTIRTNPIFPFACW